MREEFEKLWDLCMSVSADDRMSVERFEDARMGLLSAVESKLTITEEEILKQVKEAVELFGAVKYCPDCGERSGKGHKSWCGGITYVKMNNLKSEVLTKLKTLTAEK